MVGRSRFCVGVVVVLALAGTVTAQGDGASGPERLQVPHVSTVPANRGERVRLSVHYYASSNPTGTVVFVSSDAFPVLASWGLEGPDLNHLGTFAGRGLDVYAADVTGYGLSPRPRMDDPCSTPPETQTELLIPHPLYIPCDGEYGRVLTSLETDWDEIDTVVGFAIDRSGGSRVSLVGWGVGAARVAGYAARHPDKVERLVLVAPAYDADAPDAVPTPYPAGFPIEVHDIDAILSDWRGMETCEGFGAYEATLAPLRPTVNRLDPLAAQWGLIAGPLFRSPGRAGLQGWNRDSAARVSAPTLLVQGASDTMAGDSDALFDHLGSVAKVRLDVECGTHWLLWEATRTSIVDVVAEFLATGAVAGQSDGSLRLDAEGTVE